MNFGLDIQKAIHVTEDVSLWAIDLFKNNGITNYDIIGLSYYPNFSPDTDLTELGQVITELKTTHSKEVMICLLYTSPSPRDRTRSRMPSSA